MGKNFLGEAWFTYAFGSDDTDQFVFFDSCDSCV